MYLSLKNHKMTQTNLKKYLNLIKLIICNSLELRGSKINLYQGGSQLGVNNNYDWLSNRSRNMNTGIKNITLVIRSQTRINKNSTCDDPFKRLSLVLPRKKHNAKAYPLKDLPPFLVICYLCSHYHVFFLHDSLTTSSTTLWTSSTIITILQGCIYSRWMMCGV